ncbi:hypothetical protein Pst134EA_029139 [Puccinia striiformis f. sp. tritici]|uniref:Uncharacterized protein n=1 Tax=Puccinia striiformis f. sp. tritici PST-78 TaxID=1165861 RepID=A0A0L0UUX8_9BASI|nr:hypothetical protein Pst134EA_029139 [Puccinia striiformis f. sp. tritici]KAH9441163.1 hypothetical protein Pst134EB_029830 [Puccinia striiformis f. sp. tritici]KAH9447127.1 hypothetical protein Pst134EA_029139 [Puccinia striiformis f. sp. tritici]KNE90746.1 hypothetical protein PSTG_15810 [Puccinia striiformis f. sp. tritici PST-78]
MKSHRTLSAILLPALFSVSNGLAPSICERPPADQSAWHANHLDEYLQNYHHAGKLTFQKEYVDRVGIHDFSCGIGKECELTERDSCNRSINDSDWLVLESVANWNTYVNSLSTEIDRIGTELFTDVVTKMGRFSPQASTPQPHLHKRATSSTPEEVEKIVSGASKGLQTKDFEVDPVEIHNGLKAPMITRMVPESERLVPLKLPPVWVRMTRYLKELVRRGTSGVRKVMRATKTRRPPVPFYPSELRPVADAAGEKEIADNDAKKLKILSDWRATYSKLMDNEAPLDKDIQQQYARELSRYPSQWRDASEVEFTWVNNQLQKQSQADFVKYQEAVRAKASLTEQRDALRAEDATKLTVKNPAVLDRAKSAPKKIKSAEDTLKKSVNKEIRDLEEDISVQDTILQSLMDPKKTTSLHPSLIEPTLQLPTELPNELNVYKFRPPPPPAIFDPKELFSKRSAHLAFEKNLLRERWSRLYQEAIRLRTGETVQQSTGRLEALVKTIDDWKKLDSDHLLTRRIEVMQALIAQNTQEAVKTEILEVFRSFYNSYQEHVELLVNLQMAHPTQVSEVSSRFANRIFRHMEQDINARIRRREQEGKKTIRKRALKSSPSNRARLNGHEKSAVLSHTQGLIKKNVKKILQTYSLDGHNHLNDQFYYHQGIFNIIRDGHFLSGFDFASIIQDLECLIQLGVISRILKESEASVDVDVLATCNPQSYQYQINDKSATFCGSQGIVHTIAVGVNKHVELDRRTPNLKELNGSLNSTGIQLSEIVHLAVECHHSREGSLNEQTLVYPASLSNSLVRLTGVSTCVVDLPIHYRVTN